MQNHLARCVLLALFFIQAIFVISTKGTEGKCGRTPVDVVFVLDESGSIWGPHFTQQLQFIQDLIDGFDFGPNGTRVGVLTFGDDVRTIVQLGEVSNADQLKRIVGGIQQLRGSTGTHLALKRLREMFSERYTRPGASRVAIVITDGESDDPRLTAIEADKTHAEDITVFAIGVGVAVKKAELDRIASQPDYVFTVDNYNELSSLLYILASKACPVEELETISAETPKSTTWPEPEPAERTDYWWTVLRKTTSSPLTPQAWSTEKQVEPSTWATRKIFTFRPVQPKTIEGCQPSVTFNIYFGLPDHMNALDTFLAIQFIRDLTTILSLTPSYIRPTLCPRTCPADSTPTESSESSNSLDFMAALDGRSAEAVTQYDLQLEYIRKKEEEYRQRYPADDLDRRAAVAILMIDNRLVNAGRIMRQVRLAHKDGIQTVAIGVGDYVDRGELWGLASTDRDALYLGSICQLPTIQHNIVQRVCTRGLAQGDVQPAL